MTENSDHAVKLVLSYEKFRGRKPMDISKSRNYGADIFSNGRMIEVKSVIKGKPSVVVLNPYNIKALEKTDNFWLYVVYDTKDPKILQFSKEDILSHKKPEISWVIPIHASDLRLNKII
jgi:hypothetical protein